MLLVRYDGEDEAVDEAWPSDDLEVLAPEEDAAMAVEPAPAIEEDALPPKKRGRKEPTPAAEPAASEPPAAEPLAPAAEPPKPAEQPPAAEPPAQSKGPSLAEMATAAARAARQEAAAAPPEDSDSSDDEPIGLVAGPRV